MALVKRSSPLTFINMVMMMMMMMMLVCIVQMVNGGGLSPSNCMEERRLGVNACKPIIYGQPPSPACCQRVRVSHFECVCPAMSPKLAALIDINRAIKILKTCGRRVPRHFKCGRVQFP